MHMADALISPIVGGTMWLATAGVGTHSVNKVKTVMDEKKVPLMGVMGAFIFAAQMINFSIPGTGSSGHIGGGLLLAILLGPYAGFITMASILTIQALFFADGGLLALGCNIFNLGFFTCFIAYPLIYKRLTKKGQSTKRVFFASIVTSVIGLQLGAFSVVLETVFSGKIDLSFGAFTVAMQSVHLVIGIVEGLVVATVVSFVLKTRPEIIENTTLNLPLGSISIKKVLGIFIVAAVIMGSILSWFASSNPDGLEWSLLNNSKEQQQEVAYEVTNTAEKIQAKTAILPDYTYKKTQTTEKWPLAHSGKSVAGILGGTITVMMVCLIGFCLNYLKKRNKTDTI